MKLTEFTKEQLYWIERTADIESSMAMNKFLNLVNTNLNNLSEKEKETIKSMASELIDLHIFLKELRLKLENNRND